MNKTPNYQLNQWEAEDRVLRTDFNADNAKIDAALKAVDGRVDALAENKADASALAALSQTVARERIRVGSFVGDGTNPRTVQLPWAPTFAVLFGQLNREIAPFFLTQGHCEYVGEYNCGLDGSFTPQLSGARLTLDTWANVSGVTTHYILFR